MVTIGVIGCSNTRQAVTGYESVSQAGKLWLAADLRNYKGKTVTEWSQPSSPAWAAFDAAMVKYPSTDQIWWQLCVHQNSGSAPSQADTVLELIRQRTLLPLVVTPMDATPTCGRSDPVVSAEIVDSFVAAGLATRGPILTPLTASQTDDGCHANTAGMLVWGADLSTFFD